MNTAHATNQEQAARWNGLGGRGWVEAQALVDRLFKPIEDLLADAVAEVGARHVLDVGCGTGGTTLAMQRRAGAEGHATGVDISEPMIAAARSRAARDGARASFFGADAQTHTFAPARFDLIASRFGVMFFDDPVAAFTNLRHAVRPGAELRLAVWRGPAENPFMLAAERAAAPLLPGLEPRDPDAPGQFAWAEPERVRGILDASQWTDIALRPLDFACAMSREDLDFYFTHLGPLVRVLPDLDDRTRDRVIETVRAAFDPFVEGDQVRFVAACWMVSASAPRI